MSVLESETLDSNSSHAKLYRKPFKVSRTLGLFSIDTETRALTCHDSVAFVCSFHTSVDAGLMSNAKGLISNTSGIPGAALLSDMVEMFVVVISCGGLSSMPSSLSYRHDMYSIK